MRNKGWGASGREAGDTLPARARVQAAILRPLVPPRRASPSRHQGTAAGALQRVRAATVEVGARDAAQPGARGLQKNVYV